MTLKNLIENGLLKKFTGVSIDQIKKRFAVALKYLDFAKKNFNDNEKDEDYNKIIYTNIYDAVRITGEVFLLLNNYKAGIKDHHKTVIQAAKLLMNDSKMDEIFSRLNIMRKNRNAIDYDIETLDISNQTVEQSIKDAQKFAKTVNKYIVKKDSQRKLF